MSPIYIAHSRGLSTQCRARRDNYNYVEKTSLSLSFALFMLTRNATVGGAADWFGWSTEVTLAFLQGTVAHG